MLATLNALVVLAAEGGHGIPGSHPWAKLAVPIGFVLFIGSVYMLVRANLGTKRGYLVTATSLFGFLIIYGAFWAFGAPGTPPATGPQNLPGQELDAYEDVWRPFAGDSTIANDPDYQVAKTHPEGFAKTPQEAGLEEGFESTADDGAGEILTFFSTEEGPLTKPPVGAQWKEVPDSRTYAKAANGRPVIAATFQQTYQVAQTAPGDPAPEGPPQLTPDGARAVLEDDPETEEVEEPNVAPEGTEIGDIVEDGETFTAFAYFDAGSPMFPSLLLLGIVLLLFIVHALLLARDEQRERREREAVVAETAAPQRETVGASRT